MTLPEDDASLRGSQAPTIIVDMGVSGPDARWDPGSMLDDRYEVIEVRGGRGRSGMGVVYIVRDGAQRYALKTFQRRFMQDMRLIQRFIREAQTWMLIGFHRNVVRAHRLDIIHAAPYLFMEYVAPDVEGRVTLADHLKAGPLPYDWALDIAVQCCDGMAHAQTAVPGLVHRDLKPENILIAPDGAAKISDFGLVRCGVCGPESLEYFQRDAIDDYMREQLTQAGAIFGTPSYMAPEQFREAATVTAAADVYAFGCCLYEMFAGEPPFLAEGDTSMERLLLLRCKHMETAPAPLSSRLPGCPEELNRLVMQCLEKTPADRPHGFHELRDTLARLYGRVTGHALAAPAPMQPTPAEAADQHRSLSLLDGYQQAIQMRNLREGQERNPYAFHLAMASYFHCYDDPHEERRQLEKALRARKEACGYEAVRRLAELHLREDAPDAARAVLETFLAREPDDLDRVLEPYVRLLRTEGRGKEALALLDAMPGSMRIDFLRAEVLRGLDGERGLEPLLRVMADEVLDRVMAKIARTTPGDTVGWVYRGDVDVLRSILAVLRPEADTAVFDVADHVFWPDMSGYPDFAPEMAWLSQTAGWLCEALEKKKPDEAKEYGDIARMLGYPERLIHQREREEYHFWLQGHTDG